MERQPLRKTRKTRSRQILRQELPTLGLGRHESGVLGRPTVKPCGIFVFFFSAKENGSSLEVG